MSAAKSVANSASHIQRRLFMVFDSFCVLV